MPFSVDLIRKLESVEPQLREVLLVLLEEVERSREESVTRKEFLEFAQRTEENFERVWQAIGELAQAQKKTEERLTRLERVVEELAEAQKRTEARIEELAEAQRRTEERLERLIGEHRKTREQLGGLAHTVGYRLEDEAIWALPELLKRDFDMEIVEGLKRDYLEISPNRHIEVNIYGKGKRDRGTFVILGEAKSQLKKRDVSSFLKVIDMVRDVEGMEVFPVMVTYQTPPIVRKAAEEQGIKIYFSYELGARRP